jgi:hypothetical protein
MVVEYKEYVVLVLFMVISAMNENQMPNEKNKKIMLIICHNSNKSIITTCIASKCHICNYY